MAIICIRFCSQKAEALNNIWRGPSSFHQSLDISLSGESRERREWAALMIGIREDKLTSDLTSHPSHPITHNTRPTNSHNWKCRVCGVTWGENLGYIFYHSDLSMFPCDPFVINTRVSSSAIVITCQIQDLICVRYIVTRYDIIIFCVFILPSRPRSPILTCRYCIICTGQVITCSPSSSGSHVHWAPPPPVMQIL